MNHAASEHTRTRTVLRPPSLASGWMRRLTAVDTALVLAFLAFALLSFGAGTMLLVIEGVA